jgi:hypothetical protein
MRHVVGSMGQGAGGIFLTQNSKVKAQNYNSKVKTYQLSGILPSSSVIRIFSYFFLTTIDTIGHTKVTICFSLIFADHLADIAECHRATLRKPPGPPYKNNEIFNSVKKCNPLLQSAVCSLQSAVHRSPCHLVTLSPCYLVTICLFPE